jgi:spore maturation protein CgeB
MSDQYRFVFLGLSITSSWGNGHATTYRSLVRELAARGHDVLFLERDVPYYAANRDLPRPPHGRTAIYGSLEELFECHETDVAQADLVVVGSYVPDGCAVAEWVCNRAPRRAAFYDIDTPVTLAKMDAGDDQYLSKSLVPRFSLYLSFTGGPTLATLERRYGAQCARPLYCSVDERVHTRVELPERWELGYLGTYSDDRSPAVDALLFEPARRRPQGRFAVAGAQYPSSIVFPPNVEHTAHLAPANHAAFYSSQRFTLNVTRKAMVAAGWSPSVRLFEAAACGTPIISDEWPGLEAFFAPGREILVARSASDVVSYLDMPARQREAIARAARARVLAEHTAAHRAETLERYTRELFERQTRARAGESRAHRWEAAE